jgi:hypothetical protein
METKERNFLFALGAAVAAYLGYLWWRKRQSGGGDTVPVPTGADLKIDSVVIEPANPVPYSTPYTATVTITNHGDTEGSMDVWMGWTMDDYPGEYRTYSANNPQRVTLAAGASTTVVRSGTTISGEWWDGAIWANDHEGVDGAISAPLQVRP